MSWVKDRLIELGFADVAARLDRSQSTAAQKKAAVERKRRWRAKQKKGKKS